MATDSARIIRGTRPVVRQSFTPLLSLAVAATLGLSAERARATGDFYDEPLQTLPDYLRLDQLPAKSISQILGETTKEDDSEPHVFKFPEELSALTKVPGPEALATLDKMIATARTGSATTLLNILNDLRDLFTGPATAAETASYIQWRIDHADAFGFDFSNVLAKASPDERQQASAELIAEIDKQFAKASPALKPHWLYLHGAALYRGGQIGDSQQWFAKVAKDFPKSPRAEAALFMEIRCGIWRSRSAEYTQLDMKLVPAERPRTKKIIDEYLAKYPHGRLLGDALGWAAAFAFDGGDYATALRYYVQQLDLPGHPELADAAADMVEKTLSHLASAPKDKALAEVAKYPRAAQAIVYIIINTCESDNYNGKFETIDEVRGWRKAVLPKLAAAISAEAGRYADATWKPRELAMLAYAASGAGQHDQAVKLLESAGSVDANDDLLMARGVVFHRAKRPGDAVTALQTLVEKFPDSPLKQGALLRLGLALTDDHRGGEAVLALQRLLPKPANEEKKPDAPADPKADANEADAKDDEALKDDDYDYGAYSRVQILYNIDVNQVRALIDTLLNFAPIAELAAPTKDPKLDPVLRLKFTEAIAQRLLAKEQFDEAKKYLTPAQYGLVAAPLEKLTKAAQEAKDPAAKMAACLKLGDAWAAARGKLLTYPLDTDKYRHDTFISYSAEADSRRADSAPFIGATGNYRLDLENRDELRHAFNWWLEASDAQPGSPQNAPVLWRALKAMPQIADVSPYTYERAASRKWGDTARKLYDRLKTECPDSIEAKRYAVTWDFQAPPKKKPEDEGVSTSRSSAGTGIDAKEAFGIEEDTTDYNKGEKLSAAITELEAAMGQPDAAKLKAKVETLRKQAQDVFSGLFNARWSNLLDDLALFLSEPDPGAAVRKQYAQLRFRFLRENAIGGNGDDYDDRDERLKKDIDAALADPKNKPVSEYFEFLHLAVTANHFVFKKTGLPEDKSKTDKSDSDSNKDAPDTYRTHDYPLLAKQTQAFLVKYPKSKKREAATLLHARAVYQSSREVEINGADTWPEAPRWEGGLTPEITQQEPFDSKKVLAALDAYDQTFPGGRYAADIRGYRANVAARLHDWRTALDLLTAQLDDPHCASLHGDAAGALGDLFTQLTDERYRADLLPAIKASKRARELLTKYAAVESDANPLLYMRTWLRDQLAVK